MSTTIIRLDILTGKVYEKVNGEWREKENTNSTLLAKEPSIPPVYLKAFGEKEE
jgi:hypothetical protein